ncbi:MAG: DUF2027 domain-containing protein, partial [Flavobacteriales bacterium]|nr:DUF2027 domain-containing protein [Flavobacteriales bacterium]
MFKIGEKVKFLNEEGEAVILKFISEKTVLVKDEYGFSLEHPISQLVSAERDHSAAKKENIPAPKISEKSVSVKIPSEEKKETLPELSLAFVSSNLKQPELGDLELFFINSSNYTVLINISAKNEKEWYSLFHGEVKVSEQVPVLSFRRQNVGQVGNIVVDVLFFRSTGYALRTPISCTLKIKATRFVKNGNYTKYAELSEKALVIPIKNAPKPEANVSVAAIVRKKPKAIKKPALPQFEE